MNKTEESVRQNSGIGFREARAIGSILYLLRKMTLRKINHILWYCQRVGGGKTIKPFVKERLFS